MTRAFRSEWVKLARPTALFGTIGAMAGFVALANFGLFRVAAAQLEAGERLGQAGQAPRPLLDTIAGSSGWLVGVRASANLLGVVALVAFASNVGAEYKNGTLRFLLAAEPRRLRLLAGKATALVTLVAASVLAAILVGLLTGYAFSGMFDVPSGDWMSGDGLRRAADAFVNISLSSIGWGVVGAFLAVLLRTGAAAIGIGVGYLLVGEAIISRAIVAPVLDTESAWFPGEVLRAFAAGGTVASSYARAGVLALLYVGAMAAAAATLFHRRDVLT